MGEMRMRTLQEKKVRKEWQAIGVEIDNQVDIDGIRRMDQIK